MEETTQGRLLMEMCGKKFYGHETLKSKYIPQIPASAEREYIRLINDYMRILKEELEEELPKLKEVYKVERDNSLRMDAGFDLELAITQLFNRIQNNVVSRVEGYGLRRKLESLAHLTRKLTVREWKKACKATLGIDIMEDYYLGDFYRQALEEWRDYNVSLIKTIPEDTLAKMRTIVYDGYVNGKTTTDMARMIRKVYGISKKRAKNIARDQVAKLNGQIQRAQQQDAGINEYIWRTVGDERVRSSHHALNGKKFSWDNPPMNSDGRCCHPGQDYNCRCIGRPVFNRTTLNLPLSQPTTK